MVQSRPIDWKKYDARIQEIERQLEALLAAPPYSADDRRLSRLYLAFARLLEDRLDPPLSEYLILAEQYAATGAFPKELEGVPQRLGAMSQQVRAQEAQSGQATDQPFIYQLMETVTRPKFSIYPPTDVEPIAWMAAIGVPADDIARAVKSIYPQIQ